MTGIFIENQINVKNISKDSSFEPCLIENNERQIREICNFLQSDKNILLINGFLGSGKTLLTNFVSTYFCPDVLVIKYTCFETTVLDDMLLSFFETFRAYTVEGKICPPKIKTENFIQKINSYFNSISHPIVIILNSFELILKNNKPEILDFIKHVSSFENVKVILTSRIFNYEEFEDTNFDSVTVSPFSKEIYEKYLKNNGIKNIGPLSNELYKQTKGYYNFLNLSLRVMKFKNFNLVKLLEAFSRSGLPSYDDFILKEALTFVDPVSLHLFRLLAIMRIPIHFNLLKSLKMYNEERICFFVNNSLLFSLDESVYIPDYFREIVEKQIQNTVMLKLHKACIELYNTQLPLKPMERDLRLSRQTMRNEIDYHSLFVPKKPVVIQSATSQKPKPQVENSVETKQDTIENINFIIEDEKIMSGIASSIEDFILEKEENNLAIESSKLQLMELLNSAKEEENKYNYKNAILLYQNALTKKDDDNYDKFLPTIYLKLAEVYKKASRWYEALEYFTKAQDYYYNVSDFEKVNSIKLEIAYIYFVTYKLKNARYILTKLEGTDNLSNELRIKVNIALAKISKNIDEEYLYYKKSLSMAESINDKDLRAELYYRFAGVNDERDDVKTAVEYYKKCIESPDSHYYPRALANLAELYDEAGNTVLALKYYQKSVEADLKVKNYNGLYLSARHLAEIFASKDEIKSLNWLIKAQAYAHQLNEPYYLEDISFEIGNYYLLRKNYKSALENFEEALKYSSKENSDKISSKIEYVKGLINGRT
ncbi:hypothetical protein J6G99_01865 [bacterium]|nr:hypothetical protein [bacterium]